MRTLKMYYELDTRVDSAVASPKVSMLKVWFSTLKASLKTSWDERNLEPWTDPDTVEIKRPGQPGVLIDLKDTGRVYAIGSEPGCDVLLNPGPARAAELQVLGVAEGLRFTPFRPSHGGDFEPDSEAAAAVDVGNSLELAGHTLEITDARAPAERKLPFKSAFVAAYARAAEWFNPFLVWPPRFLKSFGADLEQASRGGTDARLPLLKKLGAVAHESESRTAEQMFIAGRKAFWAALASSIVLSAAVLAFLPRFGATAASIGTSLLVVAAIVACILVSALSAGGATVIAGIAGALIGAVSMRTESNLRDRGLEGLLPILFCVSGVMYGQYLELGWCPLPNQARSKRYEWSALGLAMMAVLFFPPTSTLARATQITGVTLIVGWSIVGLPLCKRHLMRQWSQGGLPGRRITADTLLLLDTAWTFWRRQAAYRVGAVLLAFVPLLGLLNAPAVAERFEPHRFPIGPSATIVWAGNPGASKEPTDFFMIPQSWWESWDADPRRSTLTGQQVVVALGSTQHQQLQQWRRARDVGALSAPAGGGASAGGNLWCQQPAGAPVTPPSIVLSRCYLVQRGVNELEALMGVQTLLRPASLFLLVFGFLVLWAAGGDQASVTTAFWSLASASALALVVSIDTFTSLDWLVAHWGFDQLPNSEHLRLSYGVLRSMSVLSLGAAGLALSGIAGAATVLAWLGPPRRTADGSLEPRWIVMRFAAIVLIPAVGAGVAYGADRLFFWSLPRAVSDVLSIALILSFTVVVPVVVAVVSRHGGADQPAFTGWHACAFVTTGLLVGFTFTVVLEELPFLVVVGLVTTLTILLAASLVALVFRQKLWGLARGRTLAAIVTGAALSIGWSVFEGFGLDTLQPLTTVPPVSARILSVVVALAISRPLYQWVRDFMERLTVSPKVRQAATRIPALIELLVTGVPAEAGVQNLLENELGLKDYAFFSRSAEGTFSKVLSRGDVAIPDQLTISRDLRRRLGRLEGYFDLRQAIYDLRFVTLIPELWRLDRALRSRYQHVIPATLGDVLHGFLFLGIQDTPEVLHSETGVKNLRALTVAVGRYVGRSQGHLLAGL